MAVDPLNTEGLLAASDGAVWSGVPAGSTIGHVHFYVGDLGRAEAFYHAGLGFDKVALTFPGALFISAGGYHHHVGLNTWAAGAPAASDADARLVEWELILPDDRAVASAIRGLQNAGFAEAGADGLPTATDPWGIRVVLATAESPAAPST
jgi:catechol 2,3-dioxygenase